jgi:uncharacterized protein DUF4019
MVVLLALAVPLLARAQATDSASVEVAAAQTAARAWLTLVDETRYAASWDSAAAVFRSAVTKADWERAVLQARGPFEPFGVRKLLGANLTRSLPGAPPGQYVVLQYETEVSNDRTVIETVTPKKEADGAWRVSGYFVRPR